MRARSLVPALAASTAVIAGVAVMIARDAPPSRWAVQLAAWVVAALLYLALRTGGPAAARTRQVMPVLAVLFIGASLVAPGIEGVHRWLRAGPIQLHPSALLAPWLLVLAAAPTVAAAAEAAPAKRGAELTVPSVALLIVQLLHLAQPDAGQATAVAAGAATAALARRPRPGATALALAVAHFVLAALTWYRPDPLGPATFVEDILAHAFALGAPVGLVSVATLLAVAASPILVSGPRRRGDGHQREAGADATPVAAGLAAYLAASMVVHAFGEFPVPLLGFGASPIIGTFIGLAALERVRRGGSSAHGARTSARGHRH